MTIRKLKEMIADLPDDMRVYADDSSYDMFGDDASEFVPRCVYYKAKVTSMSKRRHPRCVKSPQNLNGKR